MRTFRSLTVLAGVALAVTLSIAAAATAQQPTKKSPSLTTDDVVKSAPAPAEAPKEPVMAEGTAKPAPPAPGTAKAQGADDKVSPEEAAWRERVTKARQAADESQRRAEEGEIRITSLRNDLSRSGQSAGYRNETAAQLEQAGQHLNELRVAARDAKKDLEELLDYGKEKGYSETPGPKEAGADGTPNDKYYRSKYDKLLQDLEDSHRREQLYQNRLNDISQRMLNGSRNGLDGFTLAQLQQDREEIQSKLDESRSTVTKTQNALENLREEARRAGVNPGVFR